MVCFCIGFFSPTNCMFRLDYKLLFLEPIKKTAAVQCSFSLIENKECRYEFYAQKQMIVK
jgi:hypothetical protein